MKYHAVRGGILREPTTPLPDATMKKKKNPENDPPKGHRLNNFVVPGVSEDANVSFSGCA